jgi:two-component system LytT family response regulator
MRKIDALIVDDEKYNSDLLEHFLKQNCPIVDRIDIAYNLEEAVVKIESHRYDILFLDIILHEKTAFDLLDEISDHPFIIFVTAFDQYAIDSFKYNTIDYLLKPIQIEALTAAVDRVVERIKNQETMDRNETQRFEKSLGHEGKVDFITISSINKVNLVKKSDILYCKSSGRYTEFHLKNKNVLIASKSLGEYEMHLTFKEFFRIHNSYMINLNHLVNISKKSGHVCELVGEIQLPISRRRYDKLLHYLNIN